MDTHVHVIQPYQAPAVQPDRRRRGGQPFDLAHAAAAEAPAPEPVHEEAKLAPSPNEEGVGERVDVVA